MLTWISFSFVEDTNTALRFKNISYFETNSSLEGPVLYRQTLIFPWRHQNIDDAFDIFLNTLLFK